MIRFRKHLIAAAGIVLLAAVGTVMSPRAANGSNQNVTNVSVVSPDPLPVSGAVTGNVSATQSGPWSVGVTGNVAAAQSGTWNVGVSGTALTKNVDEPAEQPFQATVNVDLNNFSYIPVNIPSGKRLVVEYVALAGASQSPQGGVQPVILLNSSVAGSPTALYYIQPEQSTTAPTQFYHNGLVKIYADTLSIGFGFSGYTPNFLAFNVVISGHLITL